MGGMSCSRREPDLAQDTPETLRHAPAMRSPFDHARDPLISAQLKAMEKTEAQRRGEGGRGSSMVRGDRPSPTLRPRKERGPDRAAFNQSWLREQQTARLARFQEEWAASERQEQTQSPERLRRMPGYER